MAERKKSPIWTENADDGAHINGIPLKVWRKMSPEERERARAAYREQKLGGANER